MAVIEDITTDWSAAVTLAGDEFWQVRNAPVFVATNATTEPASVEDGLLLEPGDVIALGVGEVVRYRAISSRNIPRIVRRLRA